MAANLVADEIYRTRVVRDSSGNEYELSSGVDSEEGDDTPPTDLIRQLGYEDT